MDEPLDLMTDLVARLKEDHEMTPDQIRGLLESALEAVEE